MARRWRAVSPAARRHAALSVAVAVAVAAVAVASADGRGRGLLVLLCLVALALLVVGGLLARRPAAVYAAVVGLGAATQLADVPADPVVAVGLAAVAELAMAAREDLGVRSIDRAVRVGRARLLVGVAGGSVVLGAALQAVAGGSGSSGLGPTVLAAVAVVALAALVAGVVVGRRADASRSSSTGPVRPGVGAGRR